MQSSKERERNFRFRASFQKRGDFHLLTHLQLVRKIRNAMREAEIPVCMSGGSVPQPQIAFGPALPMNVESREEFLDFFCFRYYPPVQMVRCVNQFLPPDLWFLDAIQIAPSSKALCEVINGADYAVNLSSLNQQLVARSLGDFHGQHRIDVVKFKTGTVMNLKEYVRSLCFDPVTSGFVIEMRMIEGRTIGIHTAVQTIFSVEQELPTLRERLYIWIDGEKRSPLTLEWEQRQLQLHLLDLMT